MADSQQQRVYDMESYAFWGHTHHKMPLKQLRATADQICQRLGVPKVTVTIRRWERCHASYGDGAIQLDPDKGRNALSLAHELAHHVTHHQHPRAALHGPTWARCYGRLLDALYLVPFDGFKTVARRYKVRVA